MSAVLETLPLAFRPMRELDLAQVVHVEQQAYAFPWSQGIFSDCLRVGYSCWVAETSDGVDGYGIMSVGAGESHILNLCIHPRAHGQGYGRELLDHLLEVAREYHAALTFLEVRPSNHGAIRLYERAGFSVVGTRRGYYPAADGREDALILSRGLLAD
jgi:ribosomal-protein-alanine N-acetyltransferase